MLERAIQNIHTEKKALLEQAEAIIGEYWLWFQEENQRIVQLIGSGQTSQKPAQIAPVIETKRSAKDSDKSYIVWKRYSRRFAKKIKASKASLPLHSYKDLNPVTALNRCTWERSRALDTEAKLFPIRVAIDGLHQAEVRLRSAMRKISKSTNQQGESQ